MRQRHPVSRARMVPASSRARRPRSKVFLEPLPWYDGITRAVELTSQTAVWYRSGKPPVLIRWVRFETPRAPSPLRPCSVPTRPDPTQILEWFVLRWQLEVTFHEVRTHLGVETQRQWSDLAIARTTPALLGLFSWTTLAAHASANSSWMPSPSRSASALYHRRVP